MFRRGLTQFLALNAAQAIVWPLQLATIAWLAHTLGTNGFGLISFAMAIAGTIGVLADMGLGTLGARDVADCATRDAPGGEHQATSAVAGSRRLTGLVRQFLVLRLALAAGVWLISGMVILAVFGRTMTALVVWLACGTVVAQAMTCEWVVQGLARLEYAGVARVVFQVAMLGFVWLTVRGSRDLIAAALSRPLAQLVAAAALGVAVVRVLKRGVAVNSERSACPDIAGTSRPAFKPSAILRRAAPLALAGFFSHAYSQRLDHVLLGIWYPAAVVGLYAAAYTLYLGLATAIQAFVAVALPTLATAHATNHNEVRRTMRALLVSGGALGVVLAVAGFALAPLVVPWFFGRGFAAAVPLLQVLAVAPPIIAVGAVFVQALIAADCRRQVAWTYGLGAAASLALNLVLVPIYGATGAAVTTVASEFVVALGAIFFWRSHTRHAQEVPGVRSPAREAGARSRRDSESWLPI